MKIRKFFNHMGVNVIILIMLASLGTIALSSNITATFSPNIANVYYNGDTSKRNVSLMFNVYWGTEYIEPILQVLESYSASATFFVGGMWVSKYPETLQKIYDNGYEIGNHGYFHKDCDKLNYQQVQSEIYNTHKIVKEYTGYDMNLFAPPSGAFNANTTTIANNLGYNVIMWSRDTIDWRDHDEKLIYDRATKNMSSGDLILMHPTLATLVALPKILDYCVKNQFNLVSVTNNIVI